MELPKRIVYSRIIFSTGIALLASLCILFLYETYQQNLSTTVVDNSGLINQKLEAVYTNLNERESSLRAYLLSRHQADLKFGQQKKNIEKLLKAIDSLKTNDFLEEDLLELRKLNDESRSSRESVLSSIATTPEISHALILEVLERGTMRLATARTHIDKMQRMSSGESRARGIEAKTHTILATLVGVAASIFSIVVFVLAFYFIDQELKRSQEYVNETNTLNEKIAQINKELQEANANLLNLNNELGTKNFQLEKYAREISSFTHITSHDMQEPLRKIEFFISVILEKEEPNLSEDGKKILGKITQSVLRMRKLFLSMLEFSLTNKADNNVEELELNEILTSTLDTLKIYIKDSNANIESDHLPTVTGVRYQFIQLFENIISNAIKFRKKDVLPEIKITCEVVNSSSVAQPGMRPKTPYYKIDFIDNGTGFDPIYSEKIFDIFQRLVPRADAFGVGIGLTISRKIAENHKGILVAEGKPNEGAVFSLYVPVQPQDI